MSRAIDNGGPAFPTIGNIAHNSDWLSDDGMTLRDWFAGQALATAAALPHGPENIRHYAQTAYQMADAMIAARKGDAA